MYTLDANIFIRELDPYDPDHPTCRDLLAHLIQQRVPVIVPFLILAEVAGTISRTRRDPIRARLAADAIRDRVSFRFIQLDEGLAITSAEIAADYALRGADAVYVAVARAHNCTLVSLDREQRERAAPVVRTLTPTEALAALT